MSRQTWPVSRRYVLPPLALGAPLVASGRRSGWVLVGVAATVVAFFRDPSRRSAQDPSVVYAASDGYVTGVDQDVEDEALPGGRGTRITVFLSLTNVHVNRAPLPGRLVTSQQLGDGFAPALFKGAADNRRNRLVFEGERGPFVVVQVAGALARTITNWVRPGDVVTSGQRLGVIHFGSRTDVLLPAGSAEVLVKKGTRVRGGVTELARLLPGAPAAPASS
ncbi:MAG: phosphatidylserine decarboxylase family protein [Frankiales bacterium]|nr:phosphatidylserine decarboxylase family protein [Frankiales bacterium]